MAGWIKLHRTLNDNKLWLSEVFTKSQAWIDLVLNTNFKEKIINIRGHLVTIKRGQLGWSELTMAKRWRWSKGKVNRFLKWLEMEQQIVQQKNNLTTLITITNYKKYQANDTADDTADGQQTGSRQVADGIQHKKDKKEKNDKKFVPPTLNECLEYGKSKSMIIDIKFWFDYRENSEWCKPDRNKNIVSLKNWKNDMLAWNKKEVVKRKSEEEIW